jgi:repressor LexA
MTEATDRQLEVLAYIAESIDTRQRPPTYREIAMRLHLRSTNAVTDHLRALQRKGLVTLDAGVACGIAVTPEGRDALRDRAVNDRTSTLDDDSVAER